MSSGNEKGRQSWKKVENMLGNDELILGQHWSFNLRNDPKRLAFVFSRYKFAAKTACSGKRVLELGCSEGIGAPVLSENAVSYLGVDYDSESIEAAKRNFECEKMSFCEADLLDGRVFGKFDTVVSIDVIEHINPDCEDDYFNAVCSNLHSDGMAVVGTPNESASAYASAMSREGHINNYDFDRLKASMERFFHVVFIFGVNDEIVHTGFAPMSHYLMALGCGVKKLK